MPTVRIAVDTDGTREASITVTEADQARYGGRADIDAVPEVLGDAVRRVLAAAALDDYPGAVRRLIARLYATVGAASQEAPGASDLHRAASATPEVEPDGP